MKNNQFSDFNDGSITRLKLLEYWNKLIMREEFSKILRKWRIISKHPQLATNHYQERFKSGAIDPI